MDRYVKHYFQVLIKADHKMQANEKKSFPFCRKLQTIAKEQIVNAQQACVCVSTNNYPYMGIIGFNWKREPYFFKGCFIFAFK